MSRCHICKKVFKTEAARDQHSRDKHGSGSYAGPQKRYNTNSIDKEGAKAVMKEMGDLPDGAFFAMAEEMGLEPEDFVDD